MKDLARDVQRELRDARGKDRDQHRHALQHRAELRRPRRDRRRRAASWPRSVASRRRRRSTSARFAYLYTAGQPDPDLLIRTSGEMRVSNFLLWQIAYAEIWVTDTLWPDFRQRTCSKPSSRTRSAIAATAAMLFLLPTRSADCRLI
jgi:hypothetical protein